jgi:hypothetical protein
LLAILTGVFITTWYACEDDPEETCLQDEICDFKFVTICCTVENDEEVCVYKYDGNEYPDTEAGLAQVAELLGCESATAYAKAAGDEKLDVRQALEDLMNRVKAELKSKKK